jgi:hypothetical protein
MPGLVDDAGALPAADLTTINGPSTRDAWYWIILNRRFMVVARWFRSSSSRLGLTSPMRSPRGARSCVRSSSAL